MNLDLALSLLIALINNTASISALIQKAKGESRDITAAELQSVIDGDSLARANLVIAIATAKAAGK
jgi:hypothetical protein